MVNVNTGAQTELFSCGKAGTPVIVPLSSGELLLSKENVGIFIGADGKPSRKVCLTPCTMSQACSRHFVFCRPALLAHCEYGTTVMNSSWLHKHHRCVPFGCFRA